MSKLIWKYDLNTKQLVGNGIEVADNYVKLCAVCHRGIDT